MEGRGEDFCVGLLSEAARRTRIEIYIAQL